MSDQLVLSQTKGRTGFITLDRPKALNSLSLAMIRDLTNILLAWRDDATIDAVVIHSSNGKAFCAGGDIRFFYDKGRASPMDGSALLEDFFTEEYALNHLIHHFPKPYIAVMDGIVMGGGMGIAQSGPSSRVRIVTERTKMAMPEVNIGLFPDVGGSYFLSRCPSQFGAYLGVTGDVLNATDAIYAELADIFIPSSSIGELLHEIETSDGANLRELVVGFSVRFDDAALRPTGKLALQQSLIDQHFSAQSVPAINASLATDDDPIAAQILAMMAKRSPLMMCVTLEQIRRGASMSIADCLRMERSMVRHAFEQSEVVEGVRAMVVDKDNAPVWSPSSLLEVTPDMIAAFFLSAWPAHSHPLRALD